MKTVLVALAAICVVASVGVQLKSVDSQYVELNLKILDLVENVQQDRKDADWWQIGLDYNVEANIDNYTSKEAVQVFLSTYRSGYMPKGKTFSISYDRMREEAVAYIDLLYYAKDIDTFYKTAAYGRVRLNADLFILAYYLVIYQRPDTQALVLPDIFETQPEFFINIETLRNAYRVKMQNKISDAAYAALQGIFFQNGIYIFYSNSTLPTVDDYLDSSADDISPEKVESYLKQLHVLYPFQFQLLAFKSALRRLRERSSASSLQLQNPQLTLPLGQFSQSETRALFDKIQADQTHFGYQQLINEYKLNRLSSGLGKIPEFSWYKPIETGYYSDLSTNHAFYSRNQNYQINNTIKHVEDIQYLYNYEQAFKSYIKLGKLTPNNPLIDLRDPNAMEYVINYWFTSLDLFEKPKDYKRSYEIVALHLLAATPEPIDKYTVIPSALELVQTSQRDPVFFQLYSRILDFIVQWKQEYLEPYSSSQLRYDGVTINNVLIDELVTLFDIFYFDASNAIFYNDDDFRTNNKRIYAVRQPRLNHKPFRVQIEVNSDAASDALIKIFLGPNYDNYAAFLEDNWMNFVELDFFVYKLTPGLNKIERSSQNFTLYLEDPVSKAELVKLLKQGKVPLDMSEKFFYTPDRLMLPKGTKRGVSFKLYVVAYPHTPLPTELAKYHLPLPDIKPLSYPFDRPARTNSFKQPNIYNKDVIIYHEGEDDPNIFNVKQYYPGLKN